MTPEQELIAAVLDAQFLDGPDTGQISAILTTPTVQAALAKVRGQGALHRAAGNLIDALERDQHYFGDEYQALKDAYAATPKPEPVLRWEGDRLYVGAVVFAKVGEGFSSAWWRTVFDGQEYAPTLTEARTAAEQAVKDWLKRAGVV